MGALIDELRRRADAGAVDARFGVDRAAPRVPLGALLDEAGRVARVLIEAGVRPGETVPILLEGSREFLTIFLGLVWAGAVPVCLPPPESGPRQRARAERLLGGLRPRVWVAAGGGSFEAAALCEAAGGVPPLPPATDDNRPAFLQFTSGTSGDPRPLGISVGAMLGNCDRMARANGFGPGGRMVSWLPVFHDMGLVGTTLCPLLAGMSIVVLRPEMFLRDPLGWLRAIDETGGTATIGPNFAYALCARRAAIAPPARLDLSRLRVALNGAEVVLPETVADFVQRFAPFGFRADALRPGYGLAENTLAVSFPSAPRAVRSLVLDRAALAEGVVVEAAAGLASVALGQPIDLTPCRILDDAGGVLPPLRVGRIALGGACLADGPSRIAIDGAPFIDTGDVGFIDAAGELHVLGRRDDVVNVAGEKFVPDEIEAVATDAGVCRPGRAVAFGARDASLGTERLVLALEVPDRGIPEASSLRRLREALRARIGLAPADVVWLARGGIPLTTSGKLRRGELKRAYQAGEPLPGELSRLGAAPRESAPAIPG